jgi:hypothetical protein
MDELAGLSEDSRKLALHRFQLLKPFYSRIGFVHGSTTDPMERTLEINALQEVNKTVVEAAREGMVIGQV